MKKTLFAVSIIAALTACGPNQPQTVYVQPSQQQQQPNISALDGQPVYANGRPVYAQGQQVVYMGGTPVIMNNGQPQVVIVQQPQYYDNTGNLIIAGMAGYMLAGGFNNRGYYSGYGGWGGGNYSHQTVVNKTYVNNAPQNNSVQPKQTYAYKPSQAPAQVAQPRPSQATTQSYKPTQSSSSSYRSSGSSSSSSYRSSGSSSSYKARR